MQRARKLLVSVSVLALVLVMVAPPSALAAAAPPVASSPAGGGGPSLWERLLGRLGLGDDEPSGPRPGGAATQAATAVQGPVAKAKPVAPAAKPARRVKELTGRRTANQRLFALSDGRVQAELSGRPLNYRDAKGAWRPIDTRVRPAAARSGLAFQNLTNTFRSGFGARSDGLVRFELDDRQLTVGLDGPVRNLVPQASGDTVSYPDVLGGGGDLAYQVTPTALKERIVLDRPPADPTFTFTVRLEGVRAQPQPNGQIAFLPTDGDGPPLLLMPKPFMTDAREDPDSPYGKAWSDQVTQSVTQQGSTIRITVHADRAWLNSPDRKWPVVIDPTVKIAPTPSQSQDVMLLSDSPASNFEGNGRLSVGTTSTGVARSLVKFDLGTIPANTTLDSAQLQLHYDQTFTTNSNAVTIEAHRMTLGWDESTATWSSSSNGVGELGGTQVKPANLGSAWHTFNVKSITQAWVNGTQANNGFLLKAQSETLGQGGPRYQPSELVYNGETEVYPKLLVTYGRPSVTLDPPTTIHATGAELHWSAYQDPSTASGDDLVEYQVHRSVFQNFTPQASTLVAPVPAGALTYSDTSAVPTPAESPDPFGNAYYYMVAVKTKDGQLVSSPTELVRLPKAGRVLQILQGDALDTTLSSAQPTSSHDSLNNAGNAMPWLEVGNDSGTLGIARTVLKFPSMSPVPATARVEQALLTLWSTQANNANAAYEAHALTREFNESATWNNATSTTTWAAPGGDFSATVADTVDQLVTPARHNWDLTQMTQGWVATPSSNHGVLLKVANETTPAEHTLFLSSEASEFQLRPQLRITYIEPTPANTYYAPATPERIAAGDTITVPVTVTNTTTQTLRAAEACAVGYWQASYFNNTTLSGTPAGQRCEPGIDNDWGSGGPTGVGVGTDNFSVRWQKTQRFGAGTYTFTATTDDGMRVWLDSTLLIDQWKNQPPTTYTATSTVTAGDHQLKVEYYEAGVGAVAKFTVTATTQPCPVGQYQASYFNNTTLSGTPSGQRCEAGIDNDWGSGGPSGVGVGVDGFSVRWQKTQRFGAGTYTFTATADDGVRVWLDSTLLIDGWKNQPPTTYTATRTVTAGDHQLKVEYYENTGGAVAKATVTAAGSQLTYKWLLADGTTQDPASPASQVMTPLPGDLAPGDTVTVNATLKAPTPTDPEGTRLARVLAWDVFNQSTGTYLSAAPGGIGALAQHVGVEEPTSDQLGLEKFYQYAGTNTGAGATVMGNLASGNAVWSYDAFSNPSRGLATFLRLAYNSLDTSDSAMGFGWSLQASSVMRLGSPLDFHPNPNPTKVTLTDGDGTSHYFNFDSASGQWRSPAGVHLLLQRLVVCDPKTESDRAWLMTRPDRTKFYFDCDGYLSAVVDNNNNQLTFTWERRASNNKPIKFLQYITDPANRQTLNLDYYAKGQAYSYYDSTTNARITASNLTNPFIIDHVQSITSISDATTPARTLKLTYSDKGLLKELVDGDGSSLAKTFLFDYDMTQGNKNVKLVKVTDPRDHATQLAYYDPPGDDPQFHWWAKTITDRRGGQTQIAYTDPDGPQGSTLQTTVTGPLTHATSYVLDGFGRPTSATNAKGESTLLGWDGDHNVIRLEEDNHAVTTSTFDPNTGYPLTMKDAQAGADGTPATVFTYNTSLNGHVADLASKTSPEGRKWTFGYDGAGNLTSVTDPAGNATPAIPDDFTSTYAYDNLGQLQTATDAKAHATGYSDYDANGYPQTITDAKTKQTRFVYDARGNVTKVTDPLQHDTTQTYDLFDRPGEHSEPKTSTERITTPAPTYDANDNITQATAPNNAVTTYTYNEADELKDAVLPKDDPTRSQRKVTYAYDLAGNLKRQVEPNGNLTTADDFFTSYGYDQIDQLTSVSNADGDRISYAYDSVGNLVRVTDPIKTASPDPADFTAKYTYDLAHRQKTTTDAEGHVSSTDYDHDGVVATTTDQDGNKTIITPDARGKPFEVKVPRSGSGTSISYNITRYEYDQVGNRIKVTSPRGTATGVANDFLEQTTYDALDRVIERILPFDPNDARYNTPDKVTYTYDDASRLTRVSAPPSQGQTVRNDTRYAYFDNGWVKSTTDPWDILTTYDYNDLGQQIDRTVLSSGQAASRAMTWSYYPDGKLHTRTDDGVPVGRQVVVVDNTDLQNVQVVGTWPTATANPGQFKGFNYQTHAAGTGANTFTWKLNIPQDGTYQVFVRYAVGPATNAPYAVTDGTGPPRPGWSTRPSRPASGSALAASRSTPAWVQDHAVGSGQQHRGRRRGDAGPRQQRRCRQRAQGLRVPV